MPKLFLQDLKEFLAAREPHFGPCRINRRPVARHRFRERFEPMWSP